MMMTDKERLAALKAKLAARRNKPGWAESVKEIERQIAELENGN